MEGTGMAFDEMAPANELLLPQRVQVWGKYMTIDYLDP